MPRPPTPTPTLHAAARPGRSHPFDLLTLAGDGLFSWTAAMDAGVHPNVLRRALRQGELVRLRHGWYTPAASRRTPEAWHAVRLRAELAARSPGLVATHDSALVMLGLPVRPERLSAVHLGRIGPGTIGRSVVRRAGPDPGPHPGIGRAGRACVVHRVPAGARHDGGCVEPAFAVIQLVWTPGPVRRWSRPMRPCASTCSRARTSTARRTPISGRWASPGCGA
ncbi:MAG: type IV toxin-antitoxin system AbiEi family antitoxin domain-containing protein [Kineosporiaceae bacterium]|nr:type IV toxin-antitoxin system AbiEi family antitoxin domain-containing protein [Kineosporiaceae bacterium]